VVDLAKVAALGTTPIAGASPAGASARYEPEFEKLGAEIAKLESVEGRKSIRWKDVVELANTLLESKTKDLLVGAYLATGLEQTAGYKGLSTGLTVTRDMMKTFWDGLFPEKARLRARSSALQWMSERIGAELAQRPGAGRSDREVLASCEGLLGEINTLVSEKFGEEGPDLSVLTRAVHEKVSSIPPDATAGGGSEAPATLEAEASGGASGGVVRPIDSPEAARQAFAELVGPLVRVAEVLRQAGPTDPVPYRLLRSIIWSDVVATPPAKDGVAELAGGDADFAKEQEARLDKGDYAPVVAECEARFPTDPYWLDLHHLVTRALEGLGRPYAAARKVVEDSVVGVVRSAPGLLELRFSGGMAMAGEPTRLWILHELKALPSSAEASGSGSAGETALAEARKLAARKQFAEAIALIQKELKGLSHRRDRFLCRLNLAKLCQEAGKPELALPQLDGLDEEAKRFMLDEWEPALAVELARLLWKCYKASSTPQKADEYYERLCRLDLSAALAANGKG